MKGELVSISPRPKSMGLHHELLYHPTRLTRGVYSRTHTPHHHPGKAAPGVLLPWGEWGQSRSPSPHTAKPGWRGGTTAVSSHPSGFSPHSRNRNPDGDWRMSHVSRRRLREKGVK